MKTLFEAIDSADAPAVWKLVHEGDVALDGVDGTSRLTPLALAAEAGLAEIVRILLDAGADPNLGGATTPLEAAVVEGHLEVVEALIEKSVDVNQKVEEGFTPLMTAAATGNLEMVKTLLAAGARPRLLNEDRQSAISLAEEAGHDAVVSELKEASRRQRAANLEARRAAAAEAASEEAEAAPLAEEEVGSMAAAFADSEPISMLIDTDSATDSTELFAPVDDEAEAPALVGGEIDEPAGDELFAAPAEILEQEPSAAGDGGEAAFEEPPVVVEDFSVSLGEHEELLERFQEVFETGSENAARELVAEHRDFSDVAGRTLLMAAAYRGDAELVRALIDGGADVSARDRTESGQTALVYAVRSPAPNRLEVIALLVAGGADVNQRCGRSRRSALMYAAEADVYLDRPPEPVFASTTKELIRLGANLEARDRHGRTVWRLVKRDAIGAPTFSAARRRLHQMLRVLEYNGAQQIASHRM